MVPAVYISILRAKQHVPHLHEEKKQTHYALMSHTVKAYAVHAVFLLAHVVEYLYEM